jgi:hypothetical protein
LIGGSYINGKMKNNSDIDIIILLEKTKTYHRRCLVFENTAFDIQMFDPKYLPVMIAGARRKGVGATLQLFASAQILTDRSGKTATIQKTTREAIAPGPHGWDPQILAGLRFQITELLIELASNKDQQEVAACGLSLFSLLINILMPMNGGWLETGKFIPRRLPEGGELGFPALRSAYASLLAGDAHPLIHFALETLKPVGGPLWDGHLREGRFADSPLRRG